MKLTRPLVELSCDETGCGPASSAWMVLASCLPSSTLEGYDSGDRARERQRQHSPPLVERVDVPDDALDEDLVLVGGDEQAQRERRHLRHQDGVGGPVALEHLVRQDVRQLRVGQAGALQLVARLGRRLAAHERLGLRHKVRQQDLRRASACGLLEQCSANLVVQPARHRVVRAHGRQEVAGHEARALVHQLVEGVLAVGARLAPDHRAGGVVDAAAVARHVLAVALHVALLEVGGEAVQVLVVRQQRVRLGAVEVGVPDAQHGQQDGHLRRGRARAASPHLPHSHSCRAEWPGSAGP